MTMLNITGTNLTGTSGTTNRTYIVDNVDSDNLQIFISGVYLYEDTDYSVSSDTITFVNRVWDDQPIDIVYDSTITSSYGSTLALARFMGIEARIPDLTSVATSRIKEEVGTGDSSTTIFWLDHSFILADGYTIYYGADEASSIPLLETIHYTLDKDLGKITLTSTGVSLVSTNLIYAAYSYCSINLTNTQLSNAILRAKSEVDNFTNNHFADSTSATPDWNQVLDEYQDGKGAFDINYFILNKYPIPNVSTIVDGVITADDVTITVASTSGFPSSGYILIEDDKIEYTGKTSTTFTGCTSVSAHDDALTILPYVIEISTTEPGGTISWDILKQGTEFEIDFKTGRVQIYSAGATGSGTYVDIESTPPRLVANRIRLSYISGYSSIPDDIVKVTLMLASKDIMSLVVRKSHSSGMNDFNPSLINVDKDAISKILMYYRNEIYGRC